tara:strand:+ start:507 stop:767 length:261 start_codon:yes stop_codon:yes gene_type:complete
MCGMRGSLNSTTGFRSGPCCEKDEFDAGHESMKVPALVAACSLAYTASTCNADEFAHVDGIGSGQDSSENLLEQVYLESFLGLKVF